MKNEKETPTENAVVIPDNSVSYEVAVMGEQNAVKLTPEIIRDKGKELLALSINGVFDDAGYNAVKAAKMKAVKTRTAIEKLAEDTQKRYRADFNDKTNKLKEYVDPLYAACREIENGLNAKLIEIDTKRAEEAKKEADALRERTEGRDNKLYELGMLYDGRNDMFVGLGAQYTRAYLHGLTDNEFELIYDELTGRSIGGEEISTPATNVAPAPEQTHTPGDLPPVTPKKIEVVFSHALTDQGIQIAITKGQVEAKPQIIVLNLPIPDTGLFIQIVKK